MDGNVVDDFLRDLRTNWILDPDVLDAVSRTYTENVQHWVFPEEPQSSTQLPDAIECTIPELVESAGMAVGILRQVLNMLVGVNTRLNLRRAYESVEQALHLVSEEVALLEQAGELVGSGALLAPAFPGRKVQEASWCSTKGAPLTPKQIIWLASLAEGQRELSLTYADGISHHSTLPQLVAEQVLVGDRQRIWAEEERVFGEEYGIALARTCPRCNSGPGENCRSYKGMETSIHKRRYTTAS